MNIKRFIYTTFIIFVLAYFTISTKVNASETFPAKTATFDISKILYTDEIDEDSIPEFTFEFEPVSVTDTPTIGGAKDISQMPVVQTIKTENVWNKEDNESNFNNILTQKVMGSVDFTQMGIYRYKVYEKDESETNINIEYDKTQYEIEFEVFKIDVNGDGIYDALDYNYHIFETGDNTAKTELVFVNRQKTESYLVVSKQVTGKKGEKDRNFKFNISLQLQEKDYPYYLEETQDGENYEKIEGSDGIIQNGVLDIEIKHNQRVIVKEVSFASSYTVTEEQVKDYITIIKVNGSEEIKGVTTGQKTIVQGLNEVAFTNDNFTIDDFIDDVVDVIEDKIDDLINTGDIAVYALATIFVLSILGIAFVSSKNHKIEQ